MLKTDDKEIFEQKPWLNDDVQNAEKLKKLLGASEKGGSNGSSK